MFPIRDSARSRSFPIVNISLIAVNVLAFFYEIRIGKGIYEFLQKYAVVPIYLKASEISIFEKAIPFVSSIFLHGGWFHLISNMWFLWIFGDNVEDRFGHIRYLFLYILYGVCAGLVHAFLYSSSSMPTVGASGAISGVMGSYLIFFPSARIVVLFPIFFYPIFFEVYALLFIGIWFFTQLQYGTATLFSKIGDIGGVAWWAHIGGFIVGVFFGILFRKRRKG